MCLSSLLLLGVKNRQIAVHDGLGEKWDPISKITRAKRTGGMNQKAWVHYSHQKNKAKMGTSVAQSGSQPA
jgi:hypothetical protein